MSSQGCKFSMDAVAAATPAKRPSESLQAAALSPAKVPKASEVTLMEQPPKSASTARRLPAHAPVHVCVYKYTDEAGDVWNAYEGKDGVSLWQVQVEHDARPSVTFGVIQSFNDYLRQAHAGNEAIPTTLADLQAQTGIKLVSADKTDPDNAGFVQWRVAFYVAGATDALNNFLYLLDDFFVFKERAMARERPFEVHVHPHTGVAIEEADFQYEHYVFNEPAAALPLAVFEAQPVYSKRIVVLHIQPENPETMSILITGNTFKFRSRLDSHGVPSAYFAEDGDENRKHCRLMRNVDVSDAAQRQRILQLVGERVFKNLAMRVVLDSAPEQDTAVAAFVEQMREIPSLHFAIDKAADASAVSSTQAR